MKITLIALFIALTTTSLFAQNKITKEPFIIKGQITDCPEKILRIFFKDKNGDYLIDTLNLDEFGNFYLKTNKVLFPQKASIQQNKIQINDFFVAPGYNLTITGIGRDFLSLNKSKQISGIGSESNRYVFMLDSIVISRMDKTTWFQLKEEALISYINKSQHLKDSIAKVVFDNKKRSGIYHKYFSNLVQLDNKFNKLYMLVFYLKVNSTNKCNRI